MDETPSQPCIPAGPEGRHCIAALLYGARCCADGECALCRGAERSLRASGLSEIGISHRMVAWFSVIESCAVCGCPTPPPVMQLRPRTRFARRTAFGVMSAACIVCNRPLGPRGRVVCSAACWTEYRADTEGWEFMGLHSERGTMEFKLSRLSESPE